VKGVEKVVAEVETMATSCKGSGGRGRGYGFNNFVKIV
jgi:hypothetical protein